MKTLNGQELNKIIRRRKSRSRHEANQCDSGAARPANQPPISDDWFGCDPLTAHQQAQTQHYTTDTPTPKVIYTTSVKRPIHIEPGGCDTRPPRTDYADFNYAKIFKAIADAYNLTPDKLRELLQALTDSRILLGYKHPIARIQLNRHPGAA